jgi:SpoVA protein.
MQLAINILLAFAVGGAFCALGQILIDFTRLSPARILTSYVILGVVLYAVGAYQWLKEFAGCGVSVPLVGFGAVLAKGVAHAVATEGWIGILSGGLTACSTGITAALVLAIIAAFFRRPKRK